MLRFASENKALFDTLFIPKKALDSYDSLFGNSKTIVLWNQKGYIRTAFKTQGLARIEIIKQIFDFPGKDLSGAYFNARLAVFDEGILHEGDYCIAINADVIFRCGSRYYRTRRMTVNNSKGQILHPERICLPVFILPELYSHLKESLDITDNLDARIASLCLS